MSGWAQLAQTGTFRRKGTCCAVGFNANWRRGDITGRSAKYALDRL